MHALKLVQEVTVSNPTKLDASLPDPCLVLSVINACACPLLSSLHVNW